MSVSIGMAAGPIARRLGRRDGSLIPIICGSAIAIVALVAVFGPFLAPYDPSLPDQAYAYVGPMSGHPLGFDSQGRDLLSRLLAGARTTILAPTAIALIAVVVGTSLGLAAAWFGGMIDTIIAAALDLIFSFPGMLLAILAAALFGRGAAAPVLALAIAYIPYLARVVRSAALRERVKDYIVAQELQGFSGFTVCWKHLFPNLAAVVVAQGTLVFGYAIADYAAVSYLGLGVQPPHPDWGVMVSEGQLGILVGYPMESLTAGVMIVIIVVAVNILGERLMQGKEANRG